MKPEKQIRLAAKMYEARDGVRALLGDKFAERMAIGGKILRELAAEYKMGILEVAANSAMIFEKDGNSTGAVLILAAAVELLEPSV